jgi:hypothetical protein
MTIGLYLALFSDQELIRNIDPFHMILAYLLLFMRRLIISVKYGYFREEDLQRLSQPAPEWDNNKTLRRLMGQGWLHPYRFPGLIEDELTVAMDENDICLQGIPVVLDKNEVNALSKETSSHLFPAKTSATKNNEVTSGFVLYSTIKSVYHTPAAKNVGRIILMTIIIMSATPLLVKYAYGLSLFGTTVVENIISWATLFGFLNGFQLVMFGLVCAVDYERRFQTTKKLGDLVKYPGLSFRSLFNKPEGINLKPLSVFIDLQKRSNVFAWMNARKVLR